MLAARALSKETNAISLTVNGDAHQGAFYRSLARNSSTAPLTVTNAGEGTVQAVVSCQRRAADAGARRRARLQDRAQLLHARRRAGRSEQSQAEPALRRGAQGHRAAAAIRPRHGGRLSAGRVRDRQSASGLVGRYRHVVVDRRCAPSRCMREFRDDRFAAAFERKKDSPPVFTVAYVVRAVSPGNTCCRRRWSRTCTGPTASAAPRPAGSRSRRRNEAPARLIAAALGGARRRRGARRGGLCRSRSGRRRSARARQLAVVLDRDGKLLRAYATPDGRWRLPATVEDVDPRFLKLLFAYEDRRFYARITASIRWRLAARRIPTRRPTARSSPAARPSPCRWRGCWSRARTAASAPSCARSCARSSSSTRLSKPQILALYLTLAPYGGNLEGVRAASLAYFGKEPKRLTLGEAALLVALPQSPELRRPDRIPSAARAARDRVLDRAAQAGAVPRDEIARAKAEAGAASAQADAGACAACRRSGRRGRAATAHPPADDRR